MHANPTILISGLGALTALGHDMASHRQALAAQRPPFRSLGELLGCDSPHASNPAAWIEDRSKLTHRKWSPVTMAALDVARQAAAAARWTDSDRRDAALVVGTSRGNAAGWLGPWPGRRPFRLMAASNTMHSEPASAISIELGILGANHVLASGCSAGLDAIGIAMMMIQSGICQRALAVAVELPLVPLLLDNYAASGLLASSHNLDPYHPHSDGFIPGEGAAAMALERSTPRKGHVTLTRYVCNADGADPVGIPKDGGRTPALFEGIAPASIQALCPHATGTAAQRTADPAWMRRVFADQIPRVFLLKPMLGHTIGASGMVESTLLADAMASGQLPANRDGLHSPQDIILSNSPISLSGRLAKLSHGMGGHNALLIMENSHEIDPWVP